jgi:cell division protein FtsQ
VVPAPAPDGARRTIVIADDDQHLDPIYLDEDAEQRMREIHAPSTAARQRSTIVIDEYDLHSDAIPALASSSATIDPRLRARRIAVRRAVGRRRLVWAAIFAAVVLLAVAVIAVFASSLFDVRDVDTQGNVYTDPALIQSVLDELRGTPTLLVDTRKLERRLETGPWVESARVSTDFPHHALIDIRERVPQATFAGSDGQFRVIDRDGKVLAVLAGRPTAYMLLTGTAPDSEPGQFAGTAYAAAAQLVIALPPEIRSITTSIAVDTTTNELTLSMDAPNATGVQARLGTVAGIEDKLARLLRFVQAGLRADQRLDVSTAQVGT